MSVPRHTFLVAPPTAPRAPPPTTPCLLRSRPSWYPSPPSRPSSQLRTPPPHLSRQHHLTTRRSNTTGRQPPAPTPQAAPPRQPAPIHTPTTWSTCSPHSSNSSTHRACTPRTATQQQPSTTLQAPQREARLGLEASELPQAAPAAAAAGQRRPSRPPPSSSCSASSPVTSPQGRRRLQPTLPPHPRRPTQAQATHHRPAAAAQTQPAPRWM